MLKNIRFFSSLRHPAFRLLWLNISLTQLSTQMQNPLLAWIVLELTDSSFVFGIIMSLRFAPYVIGPLSGVVADRIDRRKLLIIFKGTDIVAALFLGTLILGGQIRLWHVTLIILLQSIIRTFSFPAQSAFTADIVGKENITNATALQRISMSIMGLIGPALVGAFVNQLGVGAFYFLNAAIYSTSLLFIMLIRGISTSKRLDQRSVKKNLIEGFKYSWNNRPVFGGQLIYFIVNLFPIATRRTLLWVFAANVLQADASLLGWLSTGNQLGSFAVTILVAQLGNLKKKGRLVVFSSLAWGIMWIVFALSKSFNFALFCLITMGIVSSLTMMLAQILLLINADPEMRGRVMGIRSLMISSQFPGSIIAGAIAETWGDPFAVGLEGILMAISMLIIMKTVPSLSKTD